MKKIISLLIGLVCIIGLWLPAYGAPNSKLDALVAKIDRLENYVYDNNWQEIRTYIRGPLGEVRREIALLQRELNGKQRSALKMASSQFFNDLIALDFAALDQNSDRTEAAFKTLRNDLNKMLDSLE
jgi:photosystem II protein PsbQ